MRQESNKKGIAITIRKLAKAKGGMVSKALWAETCISAKEHCKQKHEA
jgi:hypothetical protein